MKYLGVDFGLRRVGLAISEGSLVSPWKIIEGKGVKDLAEKVANVAKEFDLVVVGMPEGKMGTNVRGFIKLLKSNGLEVVETDETLSSQTALKLMVEQGVPKKKRQFNDDQAAAIILQGYLDNR